MATGLIGRLFGCPHYKRKCELVTACCKKIYACRFCHDEKETHIMNRKAVKEVVCMNCKERQTVREYCRFCGINFGEKYICLECNLFDDEYKGQFHCQGCGICRVGGRQNFFHCDKCNMCLNLRYCGAHKCVENRSHTDCPVCLEEMHGSRIELHIPDCGHLLHKPCYEKLENAGHSVCPLCKVPLKN